MDNKELFQRKKDYLVVKHNDLIQKSRFRLSLTEQKAIAYICSLIKPTKESENYCLLYEFNIRDFCKICDMSLDSGKNYDDIKRVLKKLRDSSIWFQLEDGTEVTISWLSRVILNKSNGIVQIEIDSLMAPYLFNLNKRFTQYFLRNILKMKSAYSVRLYEILKSYSNIKEKEFFLDELKKILNVESIKSYDRFPDFRRKVLEKASDEINKYTDIIIKFDAIKIGKKVNKIRFCILQKNSIERTMSYSFE